MDWLNKFFNYAIPKDMKHFYGNFRPGVFVFHDGVPSVIIYANMYPDEKLLVVSLKNGMPAYVDASECSLMDIGQAKDIVESWMSEQAYSEIFKVK